MKKNIYYQYFSSVFFLIILFNFVYSNIWKEGEGVFSKKNIAWSEIEKNKKSNFFKKDKIFLEKNLNWTLKNRSWFAKDKLWMDFEKEKK